MGRKTRATSGTDILSTYCALAHRCRLFVDGAAAGGTTGGKGRWCRDGVMHGGYEMGCQRTVVGPLVFFTTRVARAAVRSVVVTTRRYNVETKDPGKRKKMIVRGGVIVPAVNTKRKRNDGRS